MCEWITLQWFLKMMSDIVILLDTSVVTGTGNWRSGRRFLTGWSKRLFPEQPVKNIFLILSPFFDHFRGKKQVGIIF